MRLQQQLSIIQNALPILRGVVFQAGAGGAMIAPGRKTLLRPTLDALLHLPYVRVDAESLANIYSFQFADENIILEGGAPYESWTKSQMKLIAKLESIEAALILALPPTSPTDVTAIAFRLPDSEHLKDISRDLASFEKVLLPLLDLPDAGAQVRARGFDTGSMWLLVDVTLAGATLLAAICVASSKLLDLALKFSQTKSSMKEMGVKNIFLEQIEIDAKARSKDILLEKASAVDADFFKDEPSPERLLRLQNSIRLMTSLNSRGGEVRPAIEATDPHTDDAEQFPRVRHIAAKLEELDSRLLGAIPDADAASPSEIEQSPIP